MTNFIALSSEFQKVVVEKQSAWKTLNKLIMKVPQSGNSTIIKIECDSVLFCFVLSRKESKCLWGATVTGEHHSGYRIQPRSEENKNTEHEFIIFKREFSSF